jgi:hypothetical protein
MNYCKIQLPYMCEWYTWAGTSLCLPMFSHLCVPHIWHLSINFLFYDGPYRLFPSWFLCLPSRWLCPLLSFDADPWLAPLAPVRLGPGLPYACQCFHISMSHTYDIYQLIFYFMMGHTDCFLFYSFLFLAGGFALFWTLMLIHGLHL